MYPSLYPVIELGEAVKHEGAICELQDGMLLTLIYQTMIDLIRDDNGADRGYLLHYPGTEEGSCRIRGWVDYDGLRPLGDLPSDGFWPILETLLVDVDINQNRLKVFDEITSYLLP